MEGILFMVDADFSSNAVMYFEVPITWDVDAKAYIDAIPTTSSLFTYAKNKAFNDFFKGIKTYGIFSATTHLIIPIFGQVDGGVNLKNPATNLGLPASGAVATYSSLGIRFATGWSTGINKATSDLHLTAYNTSAAPDVDQERDVMAISGGSGLLGRRVAATKQAGFNLGSSYTRNLIPNHMTSVGSLIGTSYLAGTYTAVQVDGEQNSITQSFTSVANNVIIGGSSGVSNTGTTPTMDFGLFGMGTHLTLAQMAIYQGLQVNLMTALLT